MEDTESVSTLMDSTTSKIQQLQKAFAELESHRAVTLNLKWKELEEHFHGLERSLKRRFHELEDQEKQYDTKTRRAREILEKQEAAVVAKEQASLEKLQEKRDAAVFSISNALQKHRKVSSVEPVVEPYDGGQFGSPAIDDQPPDAMTAESNLGEIIDPSENGNLEYPQLVELCEQMDSEGLHKFISDNRKNLAVLKEEIPLALKAAANPAQFVLNSLEDFYPKEVSNVDGKIDSTLLGVRRTCIMIMECLSILLMSTDLLSVSDVISEDVKDQAKAIAEDIEAICFPDFVILVLFISHCFSFSFFLFYTYSSGVIEVLVNSGRQIDAVNLAFAFDLTEQFSPVPLLKSYLKEARKVSPTVKPGNASPTTGQLAALKAVIKCIEEHKLEEQYPADPLQKRLLQLEKAKAEKKRATEAAKPQPKRPRASGVGCGTFYPRVPDRYPQYMYDRQYIYPGHADNHVQPLMSSATYNFAPSHGNYFGNGYQYQTAYHH
ncbi:FRIGIDA protein [Salix suchowensis]|nr:FRIGIDA protein [Salix suchowensis]